MNISNTDKSKLSYDEFGWIIPLFFTLFSMLIIWKYLSQTANFIVGVILVFIGLLLWWMGLQALGDNFQHAFATPQVKEFVTTGIYSYIGHPIYTGISLIFFGWGLIIANWMAWIVVVLVALFLLWKRLSEDKFLQEKYGERFVNYKKKRWM